jgi:hypothetical protein
MPLTGCANTSDAVCVHTQTSCVGLTQSSCTYTSGGLQSVSRIDWGEFRGPASAAANAKESVYFYKLSLALFLTN